MAELDVLTVNLWNANPPLDQRMRELVSYLRATRPDVVMFQEVAPHDSVHVGGSGTWAHRLAGQSGMRHVVYVSAWRSPEREEGLAIVSRLPLGALHVTPLPVDEGRLPRILVTSRTNPPGCGDLTLATTHLAHRPEDADLRGRQASAAVTALSEADRPVVVGGDLNDVPGSEVLARFGAAGFRDVLEGSATPTLSDDNPWAIPPGTGRRVDHVLVAGDLEVVAAEVVLDGADGGPRVSDHHGVRARLRFG